MSKLVDGRIPARTVCPFRQECRSAESGTCYHDGLKHWRPYSCGTARAFDMIGDDGTAKVPDDKKVAETRMPFMYYNPTKKFWVVKMAKCWDLHEEGQGWMDDHRLDNFTRVPSLDISDDAWVFEDGDSRSQEIAALRKMQELWASLDFTGV